MPGPIVVVGSINIDLVTRTTCIPLAGQTVAGSAFQIHPGGKGANQAVAAARLDAPVHLIGRLGEDAFAPILRSALGGAGVNTEAVLPTPGPCGVAIILVTEGGENSIIVTAGANALLTPDDLDAQADLLRSASYVLTQLEIPLATVEHLAKMCSREGTPLILDPAPAALLPAHVLAVTRWFTPNETEAAFYLNSLVGDSLGQGSQQDDAALASRLLTAGPAGVLLKQGVRGVHLATRDGGSEQIAAMRVEAIDSTAAGDTFNGAFAAGLYQGMQPLEAARFAIVAAALSVTREGAQPSMPTLAEVKGRLAHPGC